MNSSKACWTCKERKIACDRSSPICQNCTRSRRSCRRDKVRLSWPRENDRKRAILSSPQFFIQCKKLHSEFKFINTFSRDVEMHGYLYGLDVLYPQIRPFVGAYALTPIVSLPSHYHLNRGQVALLPYFFSNVLPSLPAFDIDLEKLRSIIARFAMLNDQASSRAVLDSLLALAIAFRSGDPKQATPFVLGALSSLRFSIQDGFELEQALQHIVAGMLICSFEIHLFSRSSSSWLLYLSGTKAIINRLYRRGWAQGEDQSLLFQWVFYYDTLARLAVKHWHGRESLQLQLQIEIGIDKGESGSLTNEINQFSRSGHKALDLLSEFAVGELSPDDPQYRSTEYIFWLAQIEEQLFSVRQELRQLDSLHTLGDPSESVSVKELFVLATLLYFERKSKHLVGKSNKTEEWIQDAFLIFSRVEGCNKLFPLFIFGCEARTDNRRLLILEVIDRTIEQTNTCSLALLRALLVKVWVQDDLNVEGDQNKPCSILSIHDSVLCLL